MKIKQKLAVAICGFKIIQSRIGNYVTTFKFVLSLVEIAKILTNLIV